MQILILPSDDGRIAVRPVLTPDETYAPFIEVLRRFPCRTFQRETRTWFLPDQPGYTVPFLHLLYEAGFVNAPQDTPDAGQTLVLS